MGEPRFLGIPGSASSSVASEDDEIVAALDKGDEQRALTLMMSAHGASVYSHCARVLADAVLAQDVQQVVFVEAFRALPTFARRSSVRTWLFGIANHRCLDALKSRQRSARRFLHEEADVADGSTPVDDGLARRSLAAALDECLARLAPQLRMLVLLRYHEGFTFEQMNEMLREKAGTLQARVARALPVLRQCLQGKGFTAS